MLEKLKKEAEIIKYVVENSDVKIEMLEIELESFRSTTSCLKCDEGIETVNSDPCKEKPQVIINLLCDQCDYMNDDQLRMKLHVKECHEIQCEKCNETFAGLVKLKNHILQSPFGKS